MDKIIGKVIDKVEEHQQRHNNLKQAPIPGRETGHGIDNGSGSGMGNSYAHHDDIDLRGAADHAASHPSTNESPEFFSRILDQLHQNKQHVASERIDEQEAIAHHKAFYGPDSSTTSNFAPLQSTSSSSSSPFSGQSSTYTNTAPPKAATSTSMGTAAALQALKLFTSSGSAIPSAVGSSYTPQSSFSPHDTTLGPAVAVPSNSNPSAGSGNIKSGISQTAQSMLIGLAMSQAAKLFEQQASNGSLAREASKESAVMKAGEMALRLFPQSQRDSGPGNKYPAAGPGPALMPGVAPAGGAGGAGGNSAASGLLNLAGRLMA